LGRGSTTFEIITPESVSRLAISDNVEASHPVAEEDDEWANWE
jgi:hypothetical protein